MVRAARKQDALERLDKQLREFGIADREAAAQTQADLERANLCRSVREILAWGLGADRIEILEKLLFDARMALKQEWS